MHTASALSETLQRYFEILRDWPGYERRPAQEQMVVAVDTSLHQQQSMVIEAGTGSGKSFGYLIPAILHAKRPIVISTGTIALQEQLIQKDLPFLLEMMKTELTVRLVKGRGNYLCIQKLTEVEREVSPTSPERMHLEFLKSELTRGWDGDLATLDFPVPRELWNDIQSDSDDCLGRRCRFYNENPYRQAREGLEEADIIIANHALYLQDTVSGQALLPPHDIVIFDEAHNLKQYAINAFTTRIGKYATQKLLRKMHRRLQPVPYPFVDALATLESRLLEWLFQLDKTATRLYPDALFLDTIQHYISLLKELEIWTAGMDLEQLSQGKLEIQSELDQDRLLVQRGKLLSQVQGLITRWEYFLEEDALKDHRVNWVELDPDRLYFELKSTPLNVADILGTTLWPEKTCILTSATLSTAAQGSPQQLDFICQDLGLKDAEATVLPSPFDYASQCVLYLPKHLPEPNTPEYLIFLTAAIESVLKVSQGRAFVLFTSYANMQRISDTLIPRLPYPCKVQGDLPRNKLIQWFKGTPNSVLFATATFWEGIDIPGEALSSVIIDKIPFNHPEDPVHQAMVDYLKRQGKDWFQGYVLPQAIIKLKQGFGRLIRSKTDRGIVAIMDPRLTNKGYGRVIQRSLPEVPVVHELDEQLEVWLNGETLSPVK